MEMYNKQTFFVLNQLLVNERINYKRLLFHFKLQTLFYNFFFARRHSKLDEHP